MWDNLNGSEGRVRRTFRLVSELALEHADVGGDKGALLGFVWKETSKLAGKDDVYSVNRMATRTSCWRPKLRCRFLGGRG
jgi:hypothetical protein